ncbi:type IVB secretion system protein IcmH/DotU [Alteromonadaceae bacterium BrNp21-10]|nr:type IVB secretion system protein IcmH/DotU [Alteromonadaceae bacterium BrNp21-10]
MSNDDLDRTVIMPSPGRRRAATEGVQQPAPQTPAPPLRPQAPQPEGEGVSLQMIGNANKNPLINSATMVFSLAKQLRNTAQHSDVEGLLGHVSGLMQNFEKNCINQGIAPDVAYEARYILCAFIDEIMLNTPWGHNSVWSHRSLLSTLHNDTTGGERFFQILARKSDAPSQNGPILELMYHCLSLGFQGKFAVQDNGRAALDQITQGVYRTIRDLHGEVNQELSGQWQPATDGRPMVAKLIPWWVVAAVLGGILSIVYAGFFFTLNDDSDGVFSEIGKLGREVPQMIQSRSAIAAPLVDPAVSAIDLDQLANNLRNHLLNEIGAKQISVDQQAYGLKITVHNKGLFASASAVVSESHQNMLAKLANVLASLPGPIVVSGHSDSQKIRTLRFPSNWHLSDERARALVDTLVSAGMQRDRLVAQGKADTVPVATNDTAEGRQQNRRIEIFIRSY